MWRSLAMYLVTAALAAGCATSLQEQHASRYCSVATYVPCLVQHGEEAREEVVLVLAGGQPHVAGSKAGRERVRRLVQAPGLEVEADDLGQPRSDRSLLERRRVTGDAVGTFDAIGVVPSAPALVPRYTLYPVIADPPLDAGAVHANATVALPPVAARPVGAPGTVAAACGV